MTNEPPAYPGPSDPQNPGNQWGQQPPPPPPPGGYNAPGGYGYGPAPQTLQKATWALVLGILSLLCCGPLGIVSIILGNQAKSEIAASNGAYTGEGMAKAGVILGIIALVLMVVGIVFYAILFTAGVSTSP